MVSGIRQLRDGEAGVDQDQVAGSGSVDEGDVDALLAVGRAHQRLVAVDGDHLGRPALVGAGDAHLRLREVHSGSGFSRPGCSKHTWVSSQSRW